MGQLARLRELNTVVADTGDIDAIARYRPVDATDADAARRLSIEGIRRFAADTVMLERYLSDLFPL